MGLIDFLSRVPASDAQESTLSESSVMAEGVEKIWNAVARFFMETIPNFFRTDIPAFFNAMFPKAESMSLEEFARVCINLKELGEI